ncbi:peptidoglycan DD-metalloendopeptidase family protein [Streptomyces sp. NPDC060194]|uniref:M23 family metallopeptidase n=1 Tax=Streptomyces sp. NPDC060194 TaxID=3347069 RepID=UPI00364D8FF0
MPIKAQHKRVRPRRVVRGITAIGAGSAALALPLFGAAQAHASTEAAPAAKAGATFRSAPVHAQPKQAEKSTYTVAGGDYLYKIAQEHDVAGGWKQLYADNQDVIGGNPELIYPGQKLELDGSAAPAAQKQQAPKAAAPKPAAPKQQAPKPAAPKQEAAPQQEAKQAEAPATADSSSNSSGWVKPVDAGTSTPYRASGGSWSSGSHTGVDFSAGSGSTVKSIGQGTVVSAGWGGAYGNQVVIKHNDGHYSQYGHLSSISVSAGQSVGAGDTIGLSGSTGNSTGPHLHFEVRTGPDYGSDIDPVAFLRAHGVSV